MFGGELPLPKATKKPRRSPRKQDILCPSMTPGYYGHYGREPNTDYDKRLRLYKQRKCGNDKNLAKNESFGDDLDLLHLKYEDHARKMFFKKAVKSRVEQKWKEYQEQIEQKREKLRELLCQEERQYYYETVEMAQKAGEMRMAEMKKRSEFLKAKKEEERLKVVHEKRLQQYRARLHDIRPALIAKHTAEAKHAQLQQMRENEARREAEREIDQMWHELMLKDSQAKAAREEQEAIAEKNKYMDMMRVWDMQIKGKELQRQEAERIEQEDKMEMEKLKLQLIKEEIEVLDAKRRKRDIIAKELIEQVVEQQEYMKKRKEEEDALEEAYSKLAEMELQKELASIQDKSARLAREVAMYKEHLRDLENERKEEARQLEELLEIHRKEVEKQQDAAKCKVFAAKKALQQSVLEGRAEQIEIKKQEAAHQLKLKQAENEVLKMIYDQNERLQAESDRLERLAVLQYRGDLVKQIEYNNKLREKERLEIERQIEAGKQEEEKYIRIVEEMARNNVEGSCLHPFNKKLLEYDCKCPPQKHGKGAIQE